MVKKDKEPQKVDQLNKFYEKKFPVQRVIHHPTGSLVFDYIFGGGLPLGKVILMSSGFALGKSLISLFCCRNLLQENPDAVVLYLDIESGVTNKIKENVLQKDYKERFIHLTPRTYEDVESIIYDYCRAGNLKFVVIDSVTQLLPEAILSGQSKAIGAKATKEAIFCPKLKFWSSIYQFNLLYCNQMRIKINTMGGKSPLTAAGSFALHFYNDIEIVLRPRTFIRNLKDEKIGVYGHVTCEKNKLVGNRSAYFYLKYGYGVSNIATIIDALKFNKLCKQAGAWFEFNIPGLEGGVKTHGNIGVEKYVKENFEYVIKLTEEKGYLKKYFSEFRG